MWVYKDITASLFHNQSNILLIPWQLKTMSNVVNKIPEYKLIA